MKSLAVLGVVLCLIGLLPVGVVFAAPPDPDLQAGFPLQSYQTPDTFASGPVIATVVGNFDDDAALEIAVSSATTGHMLLWNADGSFVPAWPGRGSKGLGYPAAGNLQGSAGTLELVASFYGDSMLQAYGGNAELLAGWPVTVSVNGAPPALADVDGDGLDEIFLGKHAFRATGAALAGWPLTATVDYAGAPAIADVDGNGDLEIVLASEPVAGVVTLGVFNVDGSALAPFPVTFTGYADTFPVVGDVDGDGVREIVVVGAGASTAQILIYGAGGALERTINTMGTVDAGSAPALADLTGDGIPEIIVQTNSHLNVLRANGVAVAGWPKLLGNNFVLGSGAPVVGDLNGDGRPDVAVVMQIKNTQNGEVRVYGPDGVLLPRFPKQIALGSGAVPAIADIDRDGRNELIVTGNRMEQKPEMYDKVWAYDLGGNLHGSVEWGQFGGGAHHRGVYPAPLGPRAPRGASTLFAPFLVKSPAVTSGTIHGRVLLGGSGVVVTLDLLRYNGQNWSVLLSTTSNAAGYYSFAGAPALAEGQEYRVQWENRSQTPGRLEVVLTRSIKNYPAGGDVGLTQFDLAGLTLVSPPANAAANWPVTFTWQRAADVAEWYAVGFTRLGDSSLVCLTPRMRRTSSLTLTGLDVSCYPITGWTVLVDSMDGGVGAATELRNITIQ